MITCTTSSNPFFCPNKWQLWQQVLALLPRGRAWQSHEDSIEVFAAAESSQAGLYEIGSTGLGTEPIVERLSVLQRYWLAYAELLEYLHQRACALIEEFYCETARETIDDWALDYGFPDTCEPYSVLCDKVRAQGGATCSYLSGLAARLGYVIECRDGSSTSAANCMVADCSPICAVEPNTIFIRIITGQSPAAAVPTNFAADCLVADCTPPCQVVPSAVSCLIERYKPAHVKAIYEVI